MTFLVIWKMAKSSKHALKARLARYRQNKLSVIGRKSGPFSISAVCRFTLWASSGLGCKIAAVLNQRGDSEYHVPN